MTGMLLLNGASRPDAVDENVGGQTARKREIRSVEYSRLLAVMRMCGQGVEVAW